MLATLYQLGITPSNSRPRVSNDNPYAESLFKTLKYRPNYHSGIKFLTPAQRHNGEGNAVMENRHQVYEAAKSAHPEQKI